MQNEIRLLGLDFYAASKIITPYIGSCDVMWGHPSSTNSQLQKSPFLLYDANQLMNSGYITLLLKDLRSITDEDAINISKMFGCVMAVIKKRNNDYILMTDDSYEIQISYNGYICVRKNKALYNMCTLMAHQYLQSKGYALPYMKYSVKELVEVGIYKIIE